MPRERDRLVKGTLLAVAMSFAVTLAQQPETTMWLPDSLGGLIYPSCAAYDSENASFYIGGETSPFILVVDAATGRKAARISVDSGGTKTICYSSRHNKIYAANSERPSVAVIDGRTNAVVKTIAMGRSWSPGCMMYNPRTDQIYGTFDGGLKILDCGGDSVIGEALAYGSVSPLYYSEKSNRLAFAYQDIVCDAPPGGSITVVDCANNSVVFTIQADGGCGAVALDEANDKLVYIHGDTMKTLDMRSGKTACLTALRATVPSRCVAGRGKLHIADFGGSEVVVYDMVGDRQITRIPTTGRVTSLLRTSSGDRVFAATESGLVAIDGSGDSVAATAKAGATASVLCHAPTLNHLLCVSPGRCEATLYDCSPNATLARTRTGAVLTAMCLNSKGNKLYLADAAGDAVVPVDCRSQKVLPAIPLEANPRSGELCYLHASDSDTIICISTGGYASRMDGHLGSLIQKKQMDTYVCFACYNPRDNRLYMTTGADVKVADCSTFNIVASIEVAKRHPDPRQPPVSFGVKAACLDDQRNMMYVADEIGRSVVAIACKKESVVGSVPAGRITWSLCVNTRDGKVYYASYNDSTITVVSVGAGSTLAKIAAGRVPHALLYNPEENRLYCANEDGNSVTVIDCRTERVVQTIPVGRRPVALLWSPADKRTYVLNRGASSVSVLTSAH